MVSRALHEKIGIKENIMQFSLLIFINLFVGSMVGLERTLLPIIGVEQFGIVSTSSALSFIVFFGFSKALVNIYAGKFADKVGRKRVLLTGWFIGIFVPLLIIVASSWWMIVFANMLLGINQGLTWSMTVNMKIDLAKKTERGLAVGLNEFAGYIGVGLMSFISGYIASTYGHIMEPFYISLAIVIIGFLLSLIVKDTRRYVTVQAEIENHNKFEEVPQKEVFLQTTWKDRDLSSISFAGLSTNFKDGMTWGLFPLFFISVGLNVRQIGMIVAVYPLAWGILQMFTGFLSDYIGRKGLIISGMMLQAFSLWWILLVNSYGLWMIGAILLGIGTAMVYPTLIAAIGDITSPELRASTIGIYRFWRDSGYAFGALFAGMLTDVLNVNWAIGLVACLPFLAGLNSLIRLKETLNR